MKNSSIEWTDHTFNPWIGCTKISPGCKNCYAAALDNRWGHDRWGVGKPRERTSIANWKKPISWNAEALNLGERHRVFCASLADVFDTAVPPEWRRDLFELIAATPQLDWLVLTKRPENIVDLMPSRTSIEGEPGPWPNIWLGTTVEDQTRAYERIPALLKIPASIHFLSCEPLLEYVNLAPLLSPQILPAPIDWVIAGGESGGGARKMEPAWAKALRDQCAGAGVPFLFKQWGDFDATGKRVGKKNAGRLLDGVQHDGYPTPRAE